MKSRNKKFGGFLIFIVVFAGISAIIMLLWNAILPDITGCLPINYWQSAGLLILCRLLFGGLGKMQFGGFMMGMNHKKNKQMHENMKDFHDKLHQMSHDERRSYIRRRMAGIDDDCDFRNWGMGRSEEKESDAQNDD